MPSTFTSGRFRPTGGSENTWRIPAIGFQLTPGTIKKQTIEGTVILDLFRRKISVWFPPRKGIYLKKATLLRCLILLVSLQKINPAKGYPQKQTRRDRHIATPTQNKHTHTHTATIISMTATFLVVVQGWGTQFPS